MDLVEPRRQFAAPAEATLSPLRGSDGLLTSEVDALRHENARLADGYARAEAGRHLLHETYKEQMATMRADAARQAREFEDGLREAAMVEIRLQQASEARVAKDKDTLLTEGRRLQKEKDLQARAIEAERLQFAHEWASASELASQRMEMLTSELTQAQARVRTEESRRVVVEGPLPKGTGSEFDQPFSGGTTGLPESFGQSVSAGPAPYGVPYFIGSEQSFGFQHGFSQTGLISPVPSAQAVPFLHNTATLLANGATCLMRPCATAGGATGAAGVGSGAASGGAGAGIPPHGSAPGGGSDPNRGGQGGDRGRGRGEGSGSGERPPRQRLPAITPEKRPTRGSPGDGGGGGGPGGPDDDDLRSARSQDSDASGARSGKLRIKIDPFTIQRFPQIGDFKRWQASVVDEVVGAWHGNIDEIFEWINYIEDPRATMDDLAVTGDKFMRMDAKLRTAITKVATGELGRELTQAASEEKDLNKRLLKGRQMLFLCYQFYEVSEDKSVTYNITDLTRLLWMGDKRISDFLVSWNTVIGGMRGSLGEAPIHQWFYEQVKKSTVLKEEVAHYDRVDPGHPHKSYKWLMGAVRKYVMVKRRDLNREKNVERSFTGVALPGSAAPAKAESKAPGKGAGKDSVICHACGRKGHVKADCWSTEETRAAYRASKDGDKPRGRSHSPAAPKGKGKGKGKGKDKGKTRSRSNSPAAPKTLMICWSYNRGTCKGPCPHGRVHTKWSPEEEERANASRAKSPAAPKAAVAR